MSKLQAYSKPNSSQFFLRHRLHLMPYAILLFVVCVWAQAKCLISHTIDERGTVMDKSWSGRCLEPGDQCPANGDDKCVTNAALTMRTCYKCNIPPTCEGQLSLTAVILYIFILYDVNTISLLNSSSLGLYVIQKAVCHTRSRASLMFLFFFSKTCSFH